MTRRNPNGTPVVGEAGRAMLVVMQQPSRFEAARQEAAERGVLAECTMALEAAGRQLDRAQQLLKTAQGTTARNRAPTKTEAANALRAALQEMQGVLEEIGT